MEIIKLEPNIQQIEWNYTAIIDGNTVKGRLIWSEQLGYEFLGYECANGAFILEDWLQEGENQDNLINLIEEKEAK